MLLCIIYCYIDVQYSYCNSYYSFNITHVLYIGIVWVIECVEVEVIALDEIINLKTYV